MTGTKGLDRKRRRDERRRLAEVSIVENNLSTVATLECLFSLFHQRGFSERVLPTAVPGAGLLREGVENSQKLPGFKLQISRRRGHQ